MTTKLKLQTLEKMTPTILFDIESTGLLRRGSRIHCIVARDLDAVDTPLVFDHREEQSLKMGVETLMRSSVLVGHNIIGYDIPLLQESYDFDYEGQCIDTLVLSRLFYPHIADRDFEIRPRGMPESLYGRHSLEAWGHRLKCFKGDFAKQGGGWETYTPEMLDYCIQDTEVTVKLYELLQRRIKDYA